MGLEAWWAPETIPADEEILGEIEAKCGTLNEQMEGSGSTKMRRKRAPSRIDGIRRLSYGSGHVPSHGRYLCLGPLCPKVTTVSPTMFSLLFYATDACVSQLQHTLKSMAQFT